MWFRKSALVVVRKSLQYLQTSLRKRAKKSTYLSKKGGRINLSDKQIVSQKTADTLQEAMMYVSAATILDLGFELENSTLVDFDDPNKTQTQFEIIVFKELPKVSGTVTNPDANAYGQSLKDSAPSVDDVGTGTYL